MSLLDGGIAELFGEIFGGEYLDANIIRSSKTKVPGSGGKLTSEPEVFTCKAQPDARNEGTNAAADITERTARFLVLVNVGTFAAAGLTIDDKLQMLTGAYAGTWAISRIDTDPAASHYVLQCQKA